MNTRLMFFTALIVAYSLTMLPLCSAEVTRQQDDAERMTTVHMTIDPAPAPEPAFEYRLLAPAGVREPGNAVPFYRRALVELQRVQHTLSERYENRYQSWWHVARDEFPVDDAAVVAKAFEPLVRQHLETASLRRFADWGFEEESLRGEEPIAFLLPDVQEMRALARLLAIRARLAVVEARFADAVQSLQIAMQMARDISTCKFMVCDLVGIAIVGTLETTIEEFIASEGSPNLYWALVALPDPLIRGRDSIELELDLAFRMFPWLRDVEDAEHTADEWSRLYTETLAEVESQFGMRPLFKWAADLNGQAPEHVQDALEHGMATLYALKLYPAAKEALVAGGMSKEEVEQMPVAKALSLQTARAYRYISDEMEKLWHVPYPEASQMESRERELLHGRFEGGEDGRTLEPIPLARTLLPATVAYRRAPERLQRQLAALAVIEALRMHAAQTGSLPQELTEVKVVPVPDNPATGEPFQYDLEGDTAVLLLPPEDGFHIGKRYEIKLRQE